MPVDDVGRISGRYGFILEPIHDVFLNG